MFIQDRDAEPGSQIHFECCNALETSRKVLIILSNSYLESPSCLSDASRAGIHLRVDPQLTFSLLQVVDKLTISDF